MKDHNLILNEIHPDLLKPPHVSEALIDLVLFAQEPGPSQLSQLISHCAECEYCRTTLIILLLAESKRDQLEGVSEVAIGELLKRFITIHQQLQSTGNEQMCAYAEAIVASGKDEASKCFPVIAEHTSVCRRCRSALDDIVAFITTPEKL